MPRPELAVLVTAREWTQGYEWRVHAPIAARVGIKPAGLSEDEEIVYDFDYTLLAMQLNMAQYGLPSDGKKLERFPK